MTLAASEHREERTSIGVGDEGLHRLDTRQPTDRRLGAVPAFLQQ